MTDSEQLLPQFYVKLDGQDAPVELLHDLLDIVVESSLHLPDVATLVLHDPRLVWIDDTRLNLGKTLEISAQVDDEETKIFDGEIVEFEPDYEGSLLRLKIRAFDRLHRLARGQHVRTFVQVTDGDLVQQIAGEVHLQAEVGPTAQVHDYLLQANETNLSFLQWRAASLGYLLFVREQVLHFEQPAAGGSPVELMWGGTLREFHPRLTTIDQPASVTAQGWDPEAKQAISGAASNARGAPRIGDGRAGGAVAQEAFDIEATHLVVDRPIRTQAEADLLAQGEADRCAGYYVQADGVCGGNPAIAAGVEIQIGNIGQRFGGTYFVTSATHVFTPGEGYLTRFAVSGLHPATLLSLLAPKRQTTSFDGLVVGIVTDNDDPDRQGRVKVIYPWLSDQHTSDWARVLAIGAGSERGIQFIPEVNDEVLVGFELGDLRFPYVLGGLWNGVDSLPDPQGVSSGRVERRVIKSRSGHVITLDDADGAGGITIEDRSGNVIKIDSASGKVTVETQGDVEMKASGSLTLESQGQVEIKGMGVKIDGGGGTVDVSGSMINLN
jgi:phage protein D